MRLMSARIITEGAGDCKRARSGCARVSRPRTTPRPKVSKSVGGEATGRTKKETCGRAFRRGRETRAERRVHSHLTSERSLNREVGDVGEDAFGG